MFAILDQCINLPIITGIYYDLHANNIRHTYAYLTLHFNWKHSNLIRMEGNYMGIILI